MEDWAKPRCRLYTMRRSMGERAVAARSRKLTAIPFHAQRNEVHMGQGALRCGPYIGSLKCALGRRLQSVSAWLPAPREQPQSWNSAPDT